MRRAGWCRRRTRGVCRSLLLGVPGIQLVAGIQHKVCRRNPDAFWSQYLGYRKAIKEFCLKSSSLQSSLAFSLKSLCAFLGEEVTVCFQRWVSLVCSRGFASPRLPWGTWDVVKRWHWTNDFLKYLFSVGAERCTSQCTHQSLDGLKVCE